MVRSPEAQDARLAAWGTNSRVTEYLMERIPAPLWRAPVPGIPTRTVRSIAAHLHNARCGGMALVLSCTRSDRIDATRQMWAFFREHPFRAAQTAARHK